MTKGKECNDSMSKLNNDQFSTSKTSDSHDYVVVKDYVSDDDEVSCEKPIPRVVVEQVFDDSKVYSNVLKNKGKYYLESNSVVCHRFKDSEEVVLRNQVFVTKGNGDNVDP